MENLLFEEISFLSLIPTTKYVINYYKKGTTCRDVGRFATYQSNGSITASFDRITCIYDSRIDNLDERYDLNKVDYYFNPYRKFYTVVPQKDKIQRAMETRALDKILQHITGDSTFIYK